jgi:hypothetical protein
MVANGADAGASPQCVAASAKALLEVTSKGHLFIDDGGTIVAEYRKHLSAKGQPGPGDAFLKWVLTHEWSRVYVTRVRITRCDRGDGEDYEELPPPPPGIRYDPSDRKFLAVAAAHPEHPVVLQFLDSKWWGWRKSLAAAGVRLHFLCPRDSRSRHAEKRA